MKRLLIFLLLVLNRHDGAATGPVIYVNQVAYELHGPKMAVIQSSSSLPDDKFLLIDSAGNTVYSGTYLPVGGKNSWYPEDRFYRIRFSGFSRRGRYYIRIRNDQGNTDSPPFDIAENALVRFTLPSIIHYYFKQRANTPQEQEADRQVVLYGSNKTVDIRGGWCDASGDISKYFSHLAYTNFMLPQQIPLVTWSLINARDGINKQIREPDLSARIEAEALWGADYLVRSLSSEGYFYMTVFSYFNPDPRARRIVGLRANSVTTSDYACGFREGGGMAVAALARISGWKRNGEFPSEAYLQAARRAFDHLLKNSDRYADDGKSNILDDYCALMAATELWIVTGEAIYKEQARTRAGNLSRRITARGYFMADEKDRPFWHASDAGLPVTALCRYLDKEEDSSFREMATETIRKYLNYQTEITEDVNNPFGYARQTYSLNGKIKDGFFIPHENESGWWWQGENARLASLATAALKGANLLYQKGSPEWKSLQDFAGRQLSWILGCNPYSMCFMYGFGQQNVPYMASLFGHGSEKGGISNGITGKDGLADGGIDFKTSAEGNEWRWTEQWLPHAAWFVQAITALSETAD